MILSEFCDRLIQCQTPTVNSLIGLSQTVDRITVDSSTAHPFNVHSVGFGTIPRTGHKGRNILKNHGPCCRHGKLSDPTKLVHQSTATKNGAITDMDVSSNCRVIGHDNVVADHTVMSHVHIAHQ